MKEEGTQPKLKKARKDGEEAGFPRYKSKKHDRLSFYLNNDKFHSDGHWLSVPKLGKVNMTEELRLCGSSEEVEVHHVHAMRKLHAYPGRPKPEWVKRMIALKRKKLILCRRCHVATDNGLPITWPLISLEEIKERRKVIGDAILESRVR
jgi:hypothetical protein